MANKHVLLLGFIISSITLNAQDITLALWPAGKVPNYKKTNETERSDTTDKIRISKVQTPTIAVFLPTKNLNGQAVIICPGGGYSILAYYWEGIDVAKWLNSKGIAAIVLKYRLPNSESNIVRQLSPLMDAQRAIRLVRANAEKWKINKDRIGIMGFSAGGHLASTAGTHFDSGNVRAADTIDRISSRPDFMVLGYPVVTMSKSVMHKGSRNNLIGENPTEALANYYSGELNVTSQTPPTFLVHASDDKSVPVDNSLFFYQALRANNIPAEMHIYPKGGHGFGLGLGIKQTESWTDRCIEWLRGLVE
jgi:acetyl esterase/lipase